MFYVNINQGTAGMAILMLYKVDWSFYHQTMPFPDSGDFALKSTLYNIKIAIPAVPWLMFT